jgi:hypothetical protein
MRPSIGSAVPGALAMGSIFGALAAIAFSAGFAHYSRETAATLSGYLLVAGGVGASLGFSLMFFLYWRYGIVVGNFWKILRNFLSNLGGSGF